MNWNESTGASFVIEITSEDCYQRQHRKVETYNPPHRLSAEQELLVDYCTINFDNIEFDFNGLFGINEEENKINNIIHFLYCNT